MPSFVTDLGQSFLFFSYDIGVDSPRRASLGFRDARIARAAFFEKEQFRRNSRETR
jgi:hypothetical protein